MDPVLYLLSIKSKSFMQYLILHKDNIKDHLIFVKERILRYFAPSKYSEDIQKFNLFNE